MGSLLITILCISLALPVKANTVAEVAEETLKAEIANSDIPVLVFFTASWCGPCRLAAPGVDEIAEQYEEQIKVVKVDVDEKSSVTTQYKIRHIPSLMLFKDGKSMDKVDGVLPKTDLEKFLEKYLQPTASNTYLGLQ